MDEWTHKLVLTLPFLDRDYPKGCVITVTAGLHHLRGNAKPYFSVTGEIASTSRRGIISAGALHREILKTWPSLAKVVALHLSDADGVPLHAEANGWYWLAGYYGGADAEHHGGNVERQHWLADGTFDGYRRSTQRECLSVFAQHVRMNEDDVRQLAETWRPIEGEQWRHARRHFAKWVEAQKPRWNSEAEAAIRYLDTRIAEREPQ
jgi:hypothetical protein